jgi:hypothetical protein
VTRAAARRLLGAGVVALLLATVPDLSGFPSASPAAAAEDPQVEIVVKSMTPNVPVAGGRLTVSGQVRNSRPDALRAPRVQLRVDSEPLDTRREVGEVASGEALGRRGRPYARTDLPEDLPVGATAAFTLEAAVDELPLREFGVYVLTLEVRDGGREVGSARTFLPWAPAGEALTPTQVAWLWPLVDRPHRALDGAFTDDELATSVAPDGRLGRLLDAAASVPRVPVTHVVDPMLVDDLAAMGEGYSVRRGGRAERGLGGGIADSWLEKLRGRPSGTDVRILPYGAPDAAALTHRRLGLRVELAAKLGVARSRVPLREEVRRDLGWPVDSRADDATVATLRAAGARDVVLTGSSLPPADELPYTPTGRARLRDGTGVLLADELLSGIAATGPGRAAPTVLAKQRWLAETAMLTAERPSGVGGAPRTVLVAPPQRWAPTREWAAFLLDTTATVPWLRAVPLGTLRAAEPPDVARTELRYPDEARGRELGGAYLGAVQVLGVEVARFSRVLSNKDVVQPYELALHRLESSAWRATRPAERNRALLAVRSPLTAEREKVRVIPGSVTLGARSGPIPVTIENKLDQTVTVRLVLDPQQARLQVDRPLLPVTVGPNRREQVDVPAEAVANGVVQVTALLQTPDGAPYSAPVTIRVRVTQYGTVGAYVTIGAGVLLFVAAGTRLVRRRRAATRAAPTARRARTSRSAGEGSAGRVRQ